MDKGALNIKADSICSHLWVFKMEMKLIYKCDNSVVFKIRLFWDVSAAVWKITFSISSGTYCMCTQRNDSGVNLSNSLCFSSLIHEEDYF